MLTRQITMITHSIFAELFITDMTNNGAIINQSIVHCHYYTFLEFKLFINFFDVLFKCFYKYLRNIIIVKFIYKSNWLLRIVYRQNTLSCNKIRWECVSDTAWCSTSQGLIGMLTAVVWRIQNQHIYNMWDSHWRIVIFKRYFRFLFGKINFYSFVWFTILMMRC